MDMLLFITDYGIQLQTYEILLESFKTTTDQKYTVGLSEDVKKNVCFVIKTS